MSNRASDARRAVAEQMRAEQAAEQAPPPPLPPPPPAPAVESTRKVRQTVDLPDPQHKAFAAWRNETAVILEQTRLTSQEALAALVSLVLSDESVSRRARGEIARLAQRAKIAKENAAIDAAAKSQ